MSFGRARVRVGCVCVYESRRGRQPPSPPTPAPVTPIKRTPPQTQPLLPSQPLNHIPTPTPQDCVPEFISDAANSQNFLAWDVIFMSDPATLQRQPDGTTMADCQNMCAGDGECQYFSWFDWAPDNGKPTCFLRKAGALAKITKATVVSWDTPAVPLVLFEVRPPTRGRFGGPWGLAPWARPFLFARPRRRGGRSLGLLACGSPALHPRKPAAPKPPSTNHRPAPHLPQPLAPNPKHSKP